MWRDAQAGRIERWVRGSGIARLTRQEIRDLAQRSRRHGSDAAVLLGQLRIEHSARCRRGETFAISADAMALAQVVPGWTRERYRSARDVLIATGLIELVARSRTTAEGRIAAQYRLKAKGGRRF